MKYSDQVVELLAKLDCAELRQRIMAIEALGEIGDEDTLDVLRERLRRVNQELSALVVAVGKMKRRLNVK